MEDGQECTRGMYPLHTAIVYIHARKHIGCTITAAHYLKLYDRRRCSSLHVSDLSYFALACHQPSGHLPTNFIPTAITRRIFHHSDKCDVCLRICGANLSTSAANLECQATIQTALYGSAPSHMSL